MSRFGCFGVVVLLLAINLIILVAVAGLIALEFAINAFWVTQPGQVIGLGLTIIAMLTAVALWVRNRARSIFGIIILMIVVSLLTITAYLFWEFLPEYNKNFMLNRLQEQPVEFVARTVILLQLTIIPFVVGVSASWRRFQGTIRYAYTSPWAFIVTLTKMVFSVLLSIIGIWFLIVIILPAMGINPDLIVRNVLDAVGISIR